jgi:hypothetical protein
MFARLFDVQNGVVVPTEHCYTLKALKDVMDEYPDEYLKVYMYLFYVLSKPRYESIFLYSRKR